MVTTGTTLMLVCKVAVFVTVAAEVGGSFVDVGVLVIVTLAVVIAGLTVVDVVATAGLVSVVAVVVNLVVGEIFIVVCLSVLVTLTVITVHVHKFGMHVLVG